MTTQVPALSAMTFGQASPQRRQDRLVEQRVLSPAPRCGGSGRSSSSTGIRATAISDISSPGALWPPRTDGFPSMAAGPFSGAGRMRTLNPRNPPPPDAHGTRKPRRACTSRRTPPAIPPAQPGTPEPPQLENMPSRRESTEARRSEHCRCSRPTPYAVGSPAAPPRPASLDEHGARDAARPTATDEQMNSPRPSCPPLAATLPPRRCCAALDRARRRQTPILRTRTSSPTAQHRPPAPPHLPPPRQAFCCRRTRNLPPPPPKTPPTPLISDARPRLIYRERLKLPALPYCTGTSLGTNHA